jgi:hypothetical protein
MSFLIDTNIVSEIRKKDRCNANVAAWYASVDDAELYLSVVVTGEIRKGVEMARRRDPDKAAVLASWLEQVVAAFGERILPIDRAIADEWGRMSALRTVSVIDGLLAATAKIRDLVLVTRNNIHVVGLGAHVLNPFQPT